MTASPAAGCRHRVDNGQNQRPLPGTAFLRISPLGPGLSWQAAQAVNPLSTFTFLAPKTRTCGRVVVCAVSGRPSRPTLFVEARLVQSNSETPTDFAAAAKLWKIKDLAVLFPTDLICSYHRRVFLQNKVVTLTTKSYKTKKPQQ